MYPQLHHLIGGRVISSMPSLDVINPFDHRVLG